MQTEQRDPASLQPHPRNSRLHSDRQITELGRAIKAFGFHQPVVVDEHDTILVGHARTRAAMAIGLKAIPVVVAAGMTEAKKRALIIADNRLHEFGAGWDQDVLDGELRDLMTAGIDVTLTGFDIREIFTRAETKDEDAAPAVTAEATSQHGDVWEMDGHRLVVGDSTNPHDVSLALGGKEVNVMVTDPPYGVEYDPGWRNEVQRANGTMVSARATGKVRNDDRADWRAAWALFPGDVAYVWHASAFAPVVQHSMESVGFSLKAQIVWDKGRFVIGRGAYHWRHEPCLYMLRGKKPRENWQGGRAQESFWSISHSKSATGHGTQKPVEAMRRPILNNTVKGETIYDPFLGSGTSIIAAHTSARRCVGMELDPLYADVICRRYQDFTGKPAVHGSTGETFAAVEALRHGF